MTTTVPIVCNTTEVLYLYQYEICQIYRYYKIKLHTHGGLKYVRYIQMTNSYTSALWIKQLIVCFLFGEVMNKLGNSLTKHGEDMSSCYIPVEF
jgi:hypothetical protein